MRIAYFIDTIIPATRANTVHVMKMCEALAKENAEITLFCDSDEHVVTHKDIFLQYGIKKEFPIIQTQINSFLRKHGHRFGGMWSAYKKTLGIDWKQFDFAYGRSAYALSHIKNKIPFVFESHTEPTNLKKMESKLLHSKNCIGLVVISYALKKRYIELFPEYPADKIFVLHDCANIDEKKEGAIATLRKKSNDEVVIGYLGSLYPGKCMEVMLPIAQSRPEYLFHVVGGTPEWIEKWTESARQLQINNIIFYGHIDNSKVGDYYRAFDICVLPFSKDVFVDKNRRLNIGNWISPLKLFESMAYSKAILVSDIPTIREVLTDEVNCLFADPNCIDEWGTKLDRLINDPNLRTRLGDAANAELRENYTWKKRAQCILKIFEEGKL